MNSTIRSEGRFPQQQQNQQQQQQLPGGRFEFDDGGLYCGGWEDGKATGHGICTGPRNLGEYAGSWHLGFEVSGCYTWPSGNTFSGQWQNGKRHGLGVETRGRWVYRGEWNQGLKGRYGTRCSMTSGAKYEGTFSNGLQDGYGTETYSDGGTFQGQWLRGLRHGYGIRVSAPFSAASVQRKKSIHTQPSIEAVVPEDEQEDPVAERDLKIDSNRGGFVLKSLSDEPTVEKKRKTFAERKDQMKNSIISGLRLKKQRSTGDIDHKAGNHTSGGSLRSARSSSSFGSSAESGGLASAASETNISFVSQEEILEPNVTENYMGEWKNDKRSGFGVAERSDGLKYEGEWHNNRKYGYGVTSFKDGTKEEGKYKNNVLVSSQKKKSTFLMRASKLREKIDQAVSAAQRSAQISLQKADISMNRTATARGKAEQAEIAAMNAKEDAEIARAYASQFAPDVRMGDRMQPQFHTVISQIDSVAHQRVKSLYGRPQPPNPEVRVRPSIDVSEDDMIPSGIAARVGGRLTVDDSYVAEVGGSRRPSIQHLGDDDFAPEQFLNRSSPRNLSVRGSVRSHRSTRTNDESIPSHRSPQRSAILNQRRTDHGTTSMVNATVIEMPATSKVSGDSLVPGRSLPVPELKYTDSGSPYYAATPNPATMTPFMMNQIGTPEYMQQVADKLQQNQRGPYQNNSNNVQRYPDGRDGQRHQRFPDSQQHQRYIPDNQQYQPYRPEPAPQQTGPRRSTLPALTDPAPAAVPPKPPRTPQTQLPAIQEVRTGSTSSSLNKSIPHCPSESTMGQTKLSSSVLPRQPSQDVPSLTPVNLSRPTLSVPQRNPLLGRAPKLGSINMGSSRGSMPDIFAAVTAEPPLSREEVSRLSSDRREAVRKQKEEEERMRKNPLLFLFHPAIRGWFFRNQLTLLVAVINLALLYLFMDLLFRR